MSGSGVIPIGDVWIMLNVCAPGYTAQDHTHYWTVRWQAKTYPRLPLGGHGKRRRTGRAEIELGHVRRLVRFLAIETCAQEQIPQLKF